MLIFSTSFIDTVLFLCRENDITGVIDTTFSVEHNTYGRLQAQELKPNGRYIIVTEENKREYVQHYVNYRFKRGIEKQFHAIYKGFNEIVPTRLLQGFSEKELEVITAPKPHMMADYFFWLFVRQILMAQARCLNPS